MGYTEISKDEMLNFLKTDVDNISIQNCLFSYFVKGIRLNDKYISDTYEHLIIFNHFDTIENEPIFYDYFIKALQSDKLEWLDDLLYETAENYKNYKNFINHDQNEFHLGISKEQFYELEQKLIALEHVNYELSQSLKMFALRGRDDVGAFSSTEYRMLENIEFFQRWGNNNRQIIDKIELHIKQQRNLLSKSLQSLSENLNNYSFDIKFKENFLCSKRIEEHRDNLTLTHNIIKKF